MKIVFMGTPSYAVPTLKALIDHHEVVCVFSRADAASKRGKALLPSPVKEVALEHEILCETPRTLRDEVVREKIKKMHPDVIVVAAYGMILPKEVLDIPRYGCVNLHASLLPRWRGAAPIQRAILAGDEYTGVAFMRMEEGLDTGDFALTQRTLIGDKNTDELTHELASMAADVVIEGLMQLESGSLVWHHQDESLVTYADKIAKHDVVLSPKLSALECRRRVQASSHSAPARFKLATKTLTVVAAHVVPTELFNELSDNSSCGQGHVFINKKHIILGCNDGFLELERVKPEGKNVMPARDFAQGIQKHEDMTWEGVE